MSMNSKLPDERRRQLPKRTIIAHGLHPHPGPGTTVNDFDDPEGPSWEEMAARLITMTREALAAIRTTGMAPVITAHLLTGRLW